MPAAATVVFTGTWTAPVVGWTVNKVEQKDGCWVVSANGNGGNLPQYRLVFDLGVGKYGSGYSFDKGKPNWKPVGSSLVAQKMHAALLEWKESKEDGEIVPTSPKPTLPDLPFKASNDIILVKAAKNDDGSWIIASYNSSHKNWKKFDESTATHSASFNPNDSWESPQWIGGKYPSVEKWSSGGFSLDSEDQNPKKMWAAFMEWYGPAPTDSSPGLPYTHKKVTITAYNYDGEKWSIKADHASCGALSYRFKAGNPSSDGFVPGVLGQVTWEGGWIGFVKNSLMDDVWEAGQEYIKSLGEPEGVGSLDDVMKAAEEVVKSGLTPGDFDYSEIAMSTGLSEDVLAQIRCFAAFHDLSSSSAWSVLGYASSFGPKFPSEDIPDITDFDKIDWSSLRKSAAEKEHSVSSKGPCVICVAEAQKNGGTVPDKMKQFLAFMADDSTLGIKADLEEAKALRRQVSAFAYYHGWNRYQAVEKIKEAGEKAAYLLPYLFPAEKDAAPPDYYKLKTQTFFDLSIALYESDFQCGCNHCAKNVNHINSFMAGKNLQYLEFPEHIKKFSENASPKEGEDEFDIFKAPEPKKYAFEPKVTPAKDVEILMSKGDFAKELSAFAGFHNMNRWTAFHHLPNNWQSTFMDHLPYFNEKALKVNGALYVDTPFPHVALASGCTCAVCKYQIKTLPKTAKKAAVKKKVTKKSITDMDATFAQALGEGIEAVEASAPPMEDQIAAFAAYHELTEWYVFQTTFPDGTNLYSKSDPVPSIGDLTFHVWPDLLDKESVCEGSCDECAKQNDGEMAEPTPSNFDGFFEQMEEPMNQKISKKAGEAAAKAMAEGSLLTATGMKTISVKPGDQIVLSVTEEFQMQIPDGQQFSVIPKA